MKRRIQGLALAASGVIFLCPIAGRSQTLNPTYLSEMPAPARILGEIKGKDAEDTGERQMGAFMALKQIMYDMAWGLEHRYENRLTPDESRLELAYHTAYADLWHKVTNKEGHVYDHDRDLHNELLKKFFSENFRALYFKSSANAAAAHKAFQERMSGNSTKPAATQPVQGQPLPNGGPGSTAELRRCIASGRSMRICMSEGMGNGVEQLFGMNIKPPTPTGFRMTGDYSTADGFRLIFYPEEVTMGCRGVPSPRPYSVQVTETQARVTIQNESGPVILSLRADGKLAGSGPIRVTGQVPAGSHSEQTMGTTTQTKTTTRELTPLEAQGDANARQNATRNGQTYTANDQTAQTSYGPTGTRRVTDFVYKTANCTLGVLNPTGPSPLAQVRNDIDILTTLGAGLGTLMKGGNVQDATKEMLSPGTAVAPGLRMSGRYAGESGFSLDFHRESVTVGCGEAERALEYSIRRTANTTTLTIKDNPNPISLQVMPDGSIAGEGSVQVNGRVITGTTDDANNPFVFAPSVARCTVGRLVAGGAGAKISTAVIATAPAAATAPASPPTADAGSRSPVAAGASLRIASGPGVAELLAGKALMVLKESLEEVLAKAGISAQGGSSRISTWTHACERSPRDPICQQAISAFGNSAVARTAFDRTGTATFNNVPSQGTFYIVADTSYAHHSLWNVRVDLKPGANSITLDESNRAVIDR
ncbi:MAG TPA: hypothetical protein VGV35_17810 [Bryobacteraceae bacterium]|nr:hypothetical protein [Bryobacteraceae bacterium]